MYSRYRPKKNPLTRTDTSPETHQTSRSSSTSCICATSSNPDKNPIFITSITNFIKSHQVLHQRCENKRAEMIKTRGNTKRETGTKPLKMPAKTKDRNARSDWMKRGRREPKPRDPNTTCYVRSEGLGAVVSSTQHCISGHSVPQAHFHGA